MVLIHYYLKTKTWIRLVYLRFRFSRVDSIRNKEERVKEKRKEGEREKRKGEKKGKKQESQWAFNQTGL